MKNKRKSGFLKAACLMLTVMALSSCVLPGTLAKYVSKGTISNLTISVAKWDVTVGGSSLDYGGSAITLGESTWNIFDESSSNPEDGKIAPGTWGYLEIPIVNNSDVDADVKIEVTTPFSSDVTGLKFKVAVASEPPSDFSSAEGEIQEGGYRLNKQDGTINIYVCFSWPFEGNDETDTTKAMSGGGGEITVTLTGELTITATQAQAA